MILRRSRSDCLRVYFAWLLISVVSAGCTLSGSDVDPGQSGDDAAVGGDAAIGSSSGVPRSIRLMDLTPAQASALCDWTNLKQGGYGRSTTCPSGSVESTNRSNFDCVNSTSALGGRCVDVTVGNIEDCANAAQTDLCQFESAPECVAVATCSM
jgi:hypothetical protein